MANSTTITLREVLDLRAKGHNVWVYPRKLQVCINGYKYRPITKATARALKTT